MKETHHYKSGKRLVITFPDDDSSGGKRPDGLSYIMILFLSASMFAFILWPGMILGGLVILFGLWLFKLQRIVGCLFLAYVMFPISQEAIEAIAGCIYYLLVWPYFKKFTK